MGFNIFAMPASSILLLFSVALGVSNALPWAGPQPTNAYQPDAWSPKPTSIPADPAKLFKRLSVDVNVCGWIGGDLLQPAACSSGSSCIHDTIHGYVGCCTTSGACTTGVYTSCVDSSSTGWNLNSGLVDNGIKTCTGTSVCYRNTYPGGYYQYNCGSSWEATSVFTSFYGQISDIQLQIVYTGVNFTPTSAATTSTSSSASTATTSTTSTISPTSIPQPPTSSSPSKKNIGAIAGGTIGGFAFLSALLALAFILYRRHKSTHSYRAGPFISTHNHSQPPTSGPFQRIAPYDTPDDFMRLSTGLTTTITAGHGPPHPGTLVFPETYAYAGASDPHHPYSNVPDTPYFPRPHSRSASQDSQERDLGSREGDALVGVRGGGSSEIDDFSRSYHDAIAARMQEEEFGGTHVHSGVMPGGIGGSGIGMGLGLGLGGNHRTEDREARSEAFRERLGSLPLASHPVRSFSYDVVDQEEEERDRAPSSLSETRLLAGLGAAVGRRSPDDERPRYTLVDTVVEDVPVLQGPGQMRHERQKSRDEE